MASSAGNPVVALLEHCGIFALFASCGAASAAAFVESFPERISFLFPFPFAILFVILYGVLLRKPGRAALAAALTIAVWYASYLAAYFVGMAVSNVASPDSIAPCALGGFIGGIGLVSCARLCLPQLFSVKYFAMGALIGMCSALAFEPSIGYFELHLQGWPPPTPIRAFGFWEAMMGTYLYAISSRTKTRGVDGPAEEVDVESSRVTPR